MQLNVTTDYAMRAILYLAKKNELSSTAEISEAVNIPHSYLPAIMKKLKEADLTKVTRGVKGGWSLARRPEEISLFDIITTMETTVKINYCLEDNSKCNHLGNDRCSVYRVYCQIQNFLERELDSVKITDLIQKSA